MKNRYRDLIRVYEGLKNSDRKLMLSEMYDISLVNYKEIKEILLVLEKMNLIEKEEQRYNCYGSYSPRTTYVYYVKNEINN